MPIPIIRPYDPAPKRLLSIGQERLLPTKGTGALIVYVNETMHRQGIQLSGVGGWKLAEFALWHIKGRPFYCAVFPKLAPGDYTVRWRSPRAPATTRKPMPASLK